MNEREQLEHLKKEIYSTLGTVNQQKMMHGFQAGEKMEQYKIICALPALTDNVLNYIGYPVQVRIGSGAFGSNKILFRQADGDLILWQNQSFMALTKEQHDSILPLFAKLINDDIAEATSGYSINEGELMVGFFIEDEQNRHSSNTTTYITVKDANGQIKEQTVILD